MKHDFFESGREAYLNGHPLSSCPKNLSDEEAAEWEGGWISAQEEDFDENE